MSMQIMEIAGQKMAVLPVAEYERLVLRAEEREDIAAADEVQRKLDAGEEEYVPSALVDRLIAGENALKVWREYRGLRGRELAEHVGTTAASISRIESGAQNPTAAMWRKLARALNVDVDDILPD
jgi:DNA-binding XRE family transcriptional regulator